MKKLLVFAVTFLLASMSAFAARHSLQFCQDIGGKWSGANGNTTSLTLKQDSNGYVTGTGVWAVIVCYPAGSYNNVTFTVGNFTGGNSKYIGTFGTPPNTAYSQWSLYEVPDAGQLPSGCGPTDLNPHLDDPYVYYGEDGCATAKQASDAIVYTQVGGSPDQCLIPNGANTETFKAWADYNGNNSPGLAHFNITWNLPKHVTVSNYDWAGRTVTMIDSGLGGTCVVPIDIYAYGQDYTGADGSTDDFIGWGGADEYPNTEQANLNRFNVRNPRTYCTLTFTRGYYMDCPGGAVLAASLPMKEVVNKNATLPNFFMGDDNTIGMYINGNGEAPEAWGESGSVQVLELDWLKSLWRD